MKRFLFGFVVFLALTAGGYYLYTHFFAAEAVRAWGLIPQDAAFIIETKEPIENWKTIQKSSFWKRLLTHPYFQEINENITYIDGLVTQNETLFDLMGSRFITISLHKTSPKNFDFLFFVDLQSHATVQSFKNILPSILKTASKNISTEEYKGFNIIKIIQPETREALYLTTVDNLFLGGYSSALVRAAIDARGTSYFENQKGLKALRGSMNENDMFNVYTQYGRLNDFLSVYAAPNDMLKSLGQTGDYSGIGFNLSDADFKAHGYLYLRDSGASFLHALADAPKGRAAAAELIPARAALYTGILFDDYAYVMKHYESILKKEPAAYNEYQKNIRTVEKLLNIRIRENFIDWIKQEIAVVLLPSPENPAKPERLIFLHADDIEAARAGLDRIVRQIRKRTPLKFKEVDYKEYKINRLQVKGLFKALMGKFFKQFDEYMPYYTVVNDYVVFSTEQAPLERFLDDYIDGKTLAKSEEYQAFVSQFDAKANVFTYSDMKNAVGIMPAYLDAPTFARAQKNEAYFNEFRQIGLELKAQGSHYEMRLNMRYLPSPENAAPETDESDEKDSAAVADGRPDGAYVDTFPNGLLKEKSAYLDGKRDGDYRLYYKNEQLKEHGRYKNGIKTGNWYYYSKKGKLTRKETYDSDGKLAEPPKTE